MYTGTNPEALRSQRWISEAFILLLKKQKFSKISVTAICEKAGLSRQTFYQMFGTKEEVLLFAFNELFCEFKKQCGDFAGITLAELSQKFFEFFKKRRKFIGILVDNNMTSVLTKEFERYLPQIKTFRRINEKEAYPDFSASFIAGALSQTLIHWYERGMDLPVETLGLLTKNLVMGKALP